MSIYFNMYLPLPGQDQDALPFADDKCLIVCDGLGGSGSTRHSVGFGETEKSAYLGSRKLSEICRAFFADNYNALLSETEIRSCIEELKQAIQDGLNEYLTECPQTDDSRGGMIFPTTLAAVVYKEESEYIKASVIWAGDSRVYMISADNWLQQLSIDDVHGMFDACFGKDCAMSNCISQDQPFSINYACYKLPKNSMIFACSDGCFDFIPSPMFFELKVLQALYKADKIETDKLSESFSDVFKSLNCGDDCTLSGVVFNLGLDEMREAIKNRVTPLKALITEYNDIGRTYEQKNEARNTEIRALVSDNKRLIAEITNKTSDILFSAFKEEIDDGEEAYKDGMLLNLSSFLKEVYNPYADYLSELQQEDEMIKAKINETEKLVEECTACFGRLKALVIAAEKEKRFKEKKEKKRYLHFKGAKQKLVTLTLKNNNSHAREEEDDPRAPFFACKQELEALLSAFNDVDSISQPRIERFELLAENLTYLLNQINAELIEEAKEYEEIKAKLLPEKEYPKLMQWVIDRGVGCYRDFVDELTFGELLGAYNEYKDMAQRIDAINTDNLKEKSLGEKLSDFKTGFLSSNLYQLSACLADFDGLNLLVPENIQYQANQKKLDSIQKELDGGVELQKQVWFKYKENYELYNECCYCGRV